MLLPRTISKSSHDIRSSNVTFIESNTEKGFDKGYLPYITDSVTRNFQKFYKTVPAIECELFSTLVYSLNTIQKKHVRSMNGPPLVWNVTRLLSKYSTGGRHRNVRSFPCIQKGEIREINSCGQRTYSAIRINLLSICEKLWHDKLFDVSKLSNTVNYI